MNLVICKSVAGGRSSSSKIKKANHLFEIQVAVKVVGFEV
jgi:hypothetical protein